MGNQLWMVPIFIVCGIAALWNGYMMTFRTREYLELKKHAAEEKRRKQAAIFTGAKMGMGIAKMFMKK